MNPFPGQASLTVNLTSPSGSGLIVSSGGTDVHGSWPTPIEETGNDARIAANAMAGVEALTDRTNWLGWRAADWIAGGDYTALFRAVISISNALTIDRSALTDSRSALIVRGSNQSGGGPPYGGDGIDAYGDGTEGVGGYGQGGTGTAHGWDGVSGQLGGYGVRGRAYPGSNGAGGRFEGDGNGAAVEAQSPGGIVPSIKNLGGSVYVDTNGPAGDPGINALWGDGIVKCQGAGHTDGSNHVALDYQVNCSTPALLTVGGGHQVNITFARAMHDSTYSVHVEACLDGSDDGLTCHSMLNHAGLTHGTAGFSFIARNIVSGAYVDFSAVATHFTFHVLGRMT